MQTITLLQTLAAKCPFTDGIAVYQARALLAPVDTTVYYNFCESYFPNGNNERIITKTTLNNNNISIYPNPTNDVLNISSDNIILKTTILTIDGKIIKEEVNNKSINVADLVRGIYFIQISTNNNIITEKFIKN